MREKTYLVIILQYSASMYMYYSSLGDSKKIKKKKGKKNYQTLLQFKK